MGIFKKNEIDMVNGPLFSNIVRYTLPLIVTSILQLLFNAADLIVVGRFCGSACIAAVGATGSLTTLFVNEFIALSHGVSVGVARGIGAKDDDAVQRMVHTAIPVAFFAGVTISVLGITFCRTFLVWMDTPKLILDLSVKYMSIYFCGMIPNMVFNFSAAVLRASGDTKSPFIYLTTAGAVNVVLNVFFVTVFKMDVDGVAFATVVSQTISAILVLRKLIKRDDACKLMIKKVRFYRDEFRLILKIGIPSGIQAMTFSISNVMVQRALNSFDSATIIAGNSAASNIENFLYGAMHAFYTTGINFTSQNVGAKNTKRIPKILKTCVLTMSAMAIVVGVSMRLAGYPLLSIYIKDDPDAIAFGLIRLTIVGMPYFICGIMDTLTGCIRGMGSAVMPMFISIATVCGLRLLWIFTIFRYFHTIEMLYYSYPLSWILCDIFQFISFIVVYKKLKKQLI